MNIAKMLCEDASALRRGTSPRRSSKFLLQLADLSYNDSFFEILTAEIIAAPGHLEGD